MREAGYDACSIRVDVTQEEDVGRAVAETVARWGRIDILVNNAAIPGANKLTHDLALPEWEQVFAVNVRGPFLCSKHVLPHMMQARRGAIVHFSSIYALVGNDDLPPYHGHQGRDLGDDEDGRHLLCALRHQGELRASRLDQDAAVHQGRGDIPRGIRILPRDDAGEASAAIGGSRSTSPTACCSLRRMKPASSPAQVLSAMADTRSSRNTDMQAVRFHTKRDIRVENIAPPHGDLKPHEALIEPLLCGICGTDLHEFIAGPIVTPIEPNKLTGAVLPQILGHEFSARVVRVGSDVTPCGPW